ncbi:hypothetical protein OIU78_018413, partial [Salix suchowensis]
MEGSDVFHCQLLSFPSLMYSKLILGACQVNY